MIGTVGILFTLCYKDLVIPRTRIKYTCGNADYMIHNKERQEMTVFFFKNCIFIT